MGARNRYAGLRGNLPALGSWNVEALFHSLRRACCRRNGLAANMARHCWNSEALLPGNAGAGGRAGAGALLPRGARTLGNADSLTFTSGFDNRHRYTLFLGNGLAF